MRHPRFLSYVALATLSSACATAGATYRSGVAPKSFDHPPFYAGAPAPAASRVVHLPVRYQRGAEQAPLFEPSGTSDSPAAALAADMSRFLDSLRQSAPIALRVAEAGTPPDVHFGCPVDAAGDCVDEGEVPASNRRLELAVGRPSEEWIAWASAALDSASADHLLLITLELGQYWPRQKGLGFSKEVELGTGYTVGVPWLTSLEKPVAVVQVTGALIGRDGRAVRIGAEGLLAKRTALMMSALGAQALLSDEDVARLRTQRRDDLPGQPLVWQTALRSLVGQLTGRNSAAN